MKIFAALGKKTNWGPALTSTSKSELAVTESLRRNFFEWLICIILAFQKVFLMWFCKYFLRLYVIVFNVKNCTRFGLAKKTISLSIKLHMYIHTWNAVHAFYYFLILSMIKPFPAHFAIKIDADIHQIQLCHSIQESWHPFYLTSSAPTFNLFCNMTWLDSPFRGQACYSGTRTKMT
jgi:hypothetical protein